MKRLFHLYQKILYKHPIPVQAIQTSLLMGTGDICAQFVVENKTLEDYSYVRTLQFGSLGIFLVVSIKKNFLPSKLSFI